MNPKSDLRKFKVLIEVGEYEALVAPILDNLHPGRAGNVLFEVLEDGSEFEGLRFLGKLLQTLRNVVITLVNSRSPSATRALSVFGHESARSILLRLIGGGTLLDPHVGVAAAALAKLGETRLVEHLTRFSVPSNPGTVRREAARLWWNLSALTRIGEADRAVLDQCIGAETDPEILETLHQARSMQGPTPRAQENYARGIDEIAEHALVDPGNAFHRAMIQTSLSVSDFSYTKAREVLLAEDTPPLLRLLASFAFAPEIPAGVASFGLQTEDTKTALELLEVASQSGEGPLRDAIATRSLQWRMLLDDATGRGYFAAIPRGHQWWRAWQAACENAAEAMFGSVLRGSRGETEFADGSRPDIVVVDHALQRDERGRLVHASTIADAKVGAFYDDPGWMKYVDFCDHLSIWWLPIRIDPDESSRTPLDSHFLQALEIAVCDLLSDSKSVVNSWKAIIDPQDTLIVRELLARAGIRAGDLPVHEAWAIRGHADPVVQQVIFASRPNSVRERYAKLRAWAKNYQVAVRAPVFFVDSHRRKTPYKVDLETGSCTCKHYLNDRTLIRLRCVHMFAAERLVPDGALRLRIGAVLKQLESLRTRLERRTILTASQVIARLRAASLSTEAHRMEEVAREVQTELAAWIHRYENRVEISTAFNKF